MSIALSCGVAIPCHTICRVLRQHTLVTHNDVMLAWVDMAMWCVAAAACGSFHVLQQCSSACTERGRQDGQAKGREVHTSREQ